MIPLLPLNCNLFFQKGTLRQFGKDKIFIKIPKSNDDNLDIDEPVKGKQMSRLVVIALLSSCVGDPISEKQIATSDNSEVVDDSQQYFYEAYRMTGYHDNRHLAVKMEVLGDLPQKIYLVDLSSSEPWVKVSEVVEVLLDCSSATDCRGMTDTQEINLAWANKAQVVAQLVIYRDLDDGTRATHIYNRVLTAIGEQLELSADIIEQRYFIESAEEIVDQEEGFDFLVGRQKDNFEVEVDQVFNVSFKMKNSSPEVARTPKSRRVEAHDSDGNIVDNVLAGAGALESGRGTIFHPFGATVLVASTLTTHYPVFLVPEAISRRVTKLVGYADGVKAGEVNITPLPSSRTLTVESNGNTTTYTFTPVPNANHQKGVYRWQHLILKELDGHGTFTGNSFDTKQDHQSAGSTTYSDNRPDNHFIRIDDSLPCVAPHTIYAWLQTKVNGKEVPLEKRKLYRVDCP